MQVESKIVGTAPGAKAPQTQVNIFGAWVDPISREEALQTILTWCETRAQQYVVTPNLNACRLLRTNQEFAAAYRDAGLSLPDGWPLVAGSRLTKHPVRQRVTGSDLIAPLCERLSERGFSVFFLGSSNEVLRDVSKKLQGITNKLAIVGTYSPPLGFEHDKSQIDFINKQIESLRPHAVVVALGAPKQELWMASNVKHLPIGFAIGVGGSLDFLAGKQRRAPLFFRRVCLEWLWRAGSDPARLGKRYLADAASLPLLLPSHINRHIITKRETVRQRYHSSIQLTGDGVG
jgi:N-acetylglucosaminyldiphosphoundecaprenol N-acetyl-beta-D-mannosaminyltransferase